MKKSFLPTSLLLTIIILAQASLFANGDESKRKYVTRTNPTTTIDAYFSTVRANQNTGLIDPADLLFDAQKVNTLRSEELNWTNLGPDNFGGLVSAIVYPDDSNPNYALLGTMGAGIYKTDNGGTTWKNVISDLMVSCMTKADGKIYIGTGDGKNAQKYNPLGELGYAYSFAGKGIYVLEGETLTQIYDNATDTILFVNMIAVSGTTVYAATEKGLIKSDDNATWTNIIPGDATCVVATTSGKVIAGVDGNVYRKASDSDSFDMITSPLVMTPQSVQIAVAPSNNDIVYASYIKSDGYSMGIYMSTDGLASTDASTWQLILPESSNASVTHNIYEGYGNYNNVLAVMPNNPYQLLVGASNLWEVKSHETTPTSYFVVNQISDGKISSFYNTYLHLGIHAIVFNPQNGNEMLIGTNGGVSKGTYAGETYSFSTCNKFKVDETSTSNARMLSVSPSNEKLKVLSTSLDHGTIQIAGDPSINTLQQGIQIYPNGEALQGFDYLMASAACEQSIINPEAIIITYKNPDPNASNPEMLVQRSQTMGQDYDISNFKSDENFSSKYHQSQFKLPMVLWESFNDQTSPDSVWFIADKEYDAGETIKVKSNNNGYPFDHVLENALGSRDSITVFGDTIKIYDSVYVKDIVSSRLLIAADGKSNPSYPATPLLFFTRDAIKFDKKCEWYLLANKTNSTTGTVLNGVPLSLAVTEDGNTAFLGMTNGNLYRITNINEAISKTTGDCSYSTTVIKVAKLGLTTTQSITSISIDATDSNKVLVTLGNYGNTDYVYYSTNAMDTASTTFTSVQGNLPAMPVFSSVIENGSQLAMIGTEHGVYTTDALNGASTVWSFSNGIGDVPIYDMKQQTILKDNDTLTVQYEGSDDEVIPFIGTSNCRAIYAATYGKGLFMCDNFIINPYSVGIAESKTEKSAPSLTMYPNPVKDYTTIEFEVSESNANVSYTIYDLSGRVVKSVELGRHACGIHTANIPIDLVGGTYLMQLKAGNTTTCGKFLVY